MQRLAKDAVTDPGAQAAAAARGRLCAATRQVRPVGELVRFVVGPDGAVVPDIKRRLPGRGVWITAHRHLVEEAVRRRIFGRSFKANVRVPTDLADELDRLLEQSVLNALSIAHKAGLVVLGFTKVEIALAVASPSPAVALVRARDAGEESGRRLAASLRRRAAEGKIVEAFTSAQLDLAFGRLNVVHAALLAGRASETFLARWRFLEYFRAAPPYPPHAGEGREGAQRAPQLTTAKWHYPEPGS